MAGINSGILHDAYPLSTSQIGDVEKDVILNNKCIAYLDENNEICFAQPNDPEEIKKLAWNTAHQLLEQDSSFIKKVYTKTGLDTFVLDKVLEKNNIEDSWSEPERLEGDGAEYYTLAPTALSFRSTAPLNELQEVQINGVTVDPSNYTLEEGSTIVTFPIDYLKTLNVGSYEVDVVSNSKTVKGSFTVAAPELNEYGFYYNQPYAAYVGDIGGMILGTVVVIAYEDNTLDMHYVSQDASERCSYTCNGNVISFTSQAFGMLEATIVAPDSIDASGIMYTLTQNVVADKDYLYFYDEHSSGYVVQPIDKTKSSYLPIRTGINDIDTLEINTCAFYNFNTESGNANMVAMPKIPDTVTCIGPEAFKGCTALKSVEIPASITEIGSSSFLGCVALENVSFEDGIHLSFGTHAKIFENCISLRNITFPEGVTWVCNNMFNDCTNLTSITLPVSIKGIQSQAFYGCAALTTITFLGTVEQWNAVNKAVDEYPWDDRTGEYTIYCTDGEIAKDGTVTYN